MTNRTQAPQCNGAQVFGPRLDIFDLVKRNVTAIDVAKRYGFSPNRYGYIRCPFHTEKTPSLMLYPGTRGWHCFGCGAGGSVIDFVAKLNEVKPLEAAKELCRDFNLGLPEMRLCGSEESKEVKYQKQLNDNRRRFEQWRLDTVTQLNKAHLIGWLARKEKPPDQRTENETLAIEYLDKLEEWAEMLESQDFDLMIMVFRERKGVDALCKTILKSTPAK